MQEQAAKENRALTSEEAAELKELQQQIKKAPCLRAVIF